MTLIWASQSCYAVASSCGRHSDFNIFLMHIRVSEYLNKNRRTTRRAYDTATDYAHVTCSPLPDAGDSLSVAFVTISSQNATNVPVQFSSTTPAVF